jgi:hypothetical protein
VPFYSVVNNLENEDSRISDLLRSVNEHSRIVKKETPLSDILISTEAPNNKELEIVRNRSIKYLSEIL